MYNSIADVFNNNDIKYNDPLYEIHNPVQNIEYPPEVEEYDDFLNNINYSAYPKPEYKVSHRIVDPLHGILKPIN